MSVSKINGFAAPYRSKTFRDEKDALVQKNGLLWIQEPIYNNSGNVIIPEFLGVQNGLVFKNQIARSFPIPTDIIPPYYVTVNSPSNVNVDDLVFQFASSPDDISINEVILAEWDGNEWRQLPFLSINGLIADRQKDNINLDMVGPRNGLQTSVVGLNYKNTKGVLVDSTGRTVELEEDQLFPIVQSDMHWDRIDRMIYRLPLDDTDRIGTRKLVIGNTFSESGNTIAGMQVISNINRHTTVKLVVDNDNNLHRFIMQGYGNQFQIFHIKMAENRTIALTPWTSLTSASSDEFDAVLDEDGNIHLAYILNSEIQHRVYDSDANLLVGPNPVITGMTCGCVSLTTKKNVLYFVFSALVGVNNSQIFFTARSLTSGMITPPVLLTNTLTNLVKPSSALSDDMLIYISFEDNTLTGQIYYMIIDDIGNIYQGVTLASGATGSTSFGTLNGNATRSKISIADNREMFITFLQKKTPTDYGIAIYHNGSAFMPNLISPTDAFNSYDMHLDSYMNELHLIASQTNRVDYIKVDNLSMVMAEQLALVGAHNVAIKKNLTGSIDHLWSSALATTFANVGATQNIQNIGPALIVGTNSNLTLSNNEASFDTSVLTYTPSVGERITVFSSPFNNGPKIITGIRLVSVNAFEDTLVVTTDDAYASPEVPSTSIVQFAKPEGNEVRAIKSVGEINAVRALRLTVLDSDLLLARIKFPGPMIINYIPPSGPGANSDLFGMYGDVDVDWGASTIGSLTMSSGGKIVDLLTHTIYSLSGGIFPMINGDALYVILDGVTTNVTPQVTSIESLPWGTPIQVLGYVENGEFNPHLFSIAGMGQLDVGEEIVLGQDLSKTLRIRLGITSENTYQPYGSTNIISVPDNYPTAISKLDQAIYDIVTDLPKEEDFSVSNPLGQTVFTTTTFNWDPNNLIPDIVVYVNGKRQRIGATRDYVKTADDSIEFTYTIPFDSTVIIREERTGGGITGPSIDLQNITTNIQPLLNGAYAVGTSSKGWKSLFIKDKLSSQVYELEVVNGTVQVVPVP